MNQRHKTNDNHSPMHKAYTELNIPESHCTLFNKAVDYYIPNPAKAILLLKKLLREEKNQYLQYTEILYIAKCLADEPYSVAQRKALVDGMDDIDFLLNKLNTEVTQSLAPELIDRAQTNAFAILRNTVGSITTQDHIGMWGIGPIGPSEDFTSLLPPPAHITAGQNIYTIPLVTSFITALQVRNCYDLLITPEKWTITVRQHSNNWFFTTYTYWKENNPS